MTVIQRYLGAVALAAGLALVLHASARAAPAPSPPADCPADQLSCGKQTPVISDGARPFRNRDLGLTMTFPAGSQVCMGRSGDSPRGFYARFGADAGCSEDPIDHPARSMGVYRLTIPSTTARRERPRVARRSR